MKNITRMLAIVVVVLSACTAEGELNESSDNINISPKQMIMTTTKSTISLSFRGIGTATIDWGDGTLPETKTLPDINTGTSINCTHNYSNTKLHAISITGNNITMMNASDIDLISLDISKNTTLEFLRCEYNQLSTLDISKNLELRYLQCGFNQLSSLDINNCTELIHLDCWSNKLSTLILNTKLEWLFCGYNQLISLDLRKCNELVYLDCMDNYMSTSNLNTLFEMLHSKPISKDIYIKDNPGTNTCNRSIAENKGWTIHY